MKQQTTSSCCGEKLITISGIVACPKCGYAMSHNLWQMDDDWPRRDGWVSARLHQGEDSA